MINNSLCFRIKLSKEEVEKHLIQILKLENLIGDTESAYFTEMLVKNRQFLFEFVVPKLTDTKE